MNLYTKAILCLTLVAVGIAPVRAQQSRSTATIRRMAVFGAGNSVEVEIIGSQPLKPEAQAITSPDRVILDFPNTVPGDALRTLVGTGEMKAVRVGLYKTNPPVTRVVLDLASPQPYQLFPSGNTLIVKLDKAMAADKTPVLQPAAQQGTQPKEVSTDDIPDALPPIRPASKLDVQYQHGNLSIWANKATLAAVLSEVHKRTGADIPIPPGAEQEQVVAKIGPAPAREALASLLNGSRFNFIMVGSDRDGSQLRSVILTVRSGGALQSSNYAPPPAPVAQNSPEPADAQPEGEIPEVPTADAPPQPAGEVPDEPIPSRDQPDPNNPPR
ncbi:MAG TPA: AMIN domain-containing protein [Terriglobales bacterium]|jgi:hypothetical protein